MKLELKRIAPLQAALMVGFITFVMVWCMYLTDWIKFLMNAQIGEPKIEGLLGSSSILAFASAFGTFISCLVYNLLAGLVGGIKYEVEHESQKA